jgi:hypothetical protein
VLKEFLTFIATIKIYNLNFELGREDTELMKDAEIISTIFNISPSSSSTNIGGSNYLHDEHYLYANNFKITNRCSRNEYGYTSNNGNADIGHNFMDDMNFFFSFGRGPLPFSQPYHQKLVEMLGRNTKEMDLRGLLRHPNADEPLSNREMEFRTVFKWAVGRRIVDIVNTSLFLKSLKLGHIEVLDCDS